MRIAPVLAIGLLLGGCQGVSPKPPAGVPQRLQGEISNRGGELMLQACQEQRPLRLSAADDLGLPAAVARLQQNATQPLFADLGGRLQDAGGQPRLALNQLYRLQAGGHGCHDPQFKRLILRASGNQPGWSVSVSDQGMILEQPGHEPLALPYVEERLPDGSRSFSSEANGRRVELWLTPERCTDSQSGALSHLQARLRLDRQPPLAGCAALGGAGE